MNFLSLEFSVFFLLFLLLYWACKALPGIQNSFILLASYYILASFHPYFALVLAGYTLGIHACALLIARWRTHGKLALGLAITLAIANLAFFKYFDFFSENINTLLLALGLKHMLPALQVMAPLGISFYTFHSISYLVSLQRGEFKPVRLDQLALFLAFFPSVIAGPINRARDFLPQITSTAPRQLDEYSRGLLLIALGILKVVWLSAVLADTWADPVFANPLEYHTLDALLGLVAYSWQIYLNFSGYTDLVTGLALLLGFRLPINFDAPYAATNLRHFWSRWHISLSTWIRDYLYIPLGGSRKGFSRTQANLMIAMVLSGLWHGASVNFLAWGAIHGLGMILLNCGDRLFGRDRLSGISLLLANTATVLYVAFAWIFFRSQTLEQSTDFIQALFSNFQQPLQFNSPFYLLLAWLLLMLYPRLAQLTRQLLARTGQTPWVLQPFVLVALVWIGMTLSPPGIPGFIYAKF